MKFHDLPLGQRFELQGEAYIKTGPLVATHAESGKQKFMARYAAVKVEGEKAPGSPPPLTRQVAVAEVRHAFEAFYRVSEALLAGLPAEQAVSAAEKLAQARKAFLDSLN